RRFECPCFWSARALAKAAPTGPALSPINRSMCAISLPSPDSASPMYIDMARLLLLKSSDVGTTARMITTPPPSAMILFWRWKSSRADPQQQPSCDDRTGSGSAVTNQRHRALPRLHAQVHQREPEAMRPMKERQGDHHEQEQPDQETLKEPIQRRSFHQADRRQNR